MIFKNVKTGEVANYSSPKLIQECLDNPDWVEGTEADLPKTPILTERDFKIQELKNKLRATDYQAIKYAEGQLTEDEYAPMKAQRQAWRDEINRLQGAGNGTF